MRYAFYTADVFTDRIFGGNQLAVFPDAQGLSGAQMQRVAREFNLSETAFVLPPEHPRHTRRLRIFTPGIELPFAGHPTVGTAYVLGAIGAIDLEGTQTHVVFEEGVGPVHVTIQAIAGRPVSAQLSAARTPVFGPEPPPAEAVAALLSLQGEDLAGGALSLQAVSCGVPFLFVPVRDRGVLGRAQVDVGRWREQLASYWAPHVYCFTVDAGPAGTDLQARMFAPAMGIEEDPATGAAATALAGYLGTRARATTATLRWVVAQGVEMGRPSILEVEADKQAGEITAVRVGGRSVMVSEGTMEIPEGEPA
jgi:trans-2,3-dihydro-3-hydroxyanthranilate isomerase